MRNDMQKVLHETSRNKAVSRGERSYREVDGESLAPTREAMRRAHVTRTERPRLNLSPLRRFIASRVGKAWDTVYAELRLAFRKSDSQLTDPLAFLDIATKTSVLDGEVVTYCRYSGVQSVKGFAFYVDPTSGLLCANDTRAGRAVARQRNEAAWQQMLLARRRDVGPMTQAHLCQGQWYLVQLAPLPAAFKTPADMPFDLAMRAQVGSRPTDVILGRAVCEYSANALCELYGKPKVFGTCKRQMNHRELRQHGLIQALTA